MTHLEEQMDLASITINEENDPNPIDLCLPHPPKLPNLPDQQQQSVQEQDDGENEDTASTTGFNNSFATVRTEIDLGLPIDYRLQPSHGRNDPYLQPVLSPDHSFQENEILRGYPPNFTGAYEHDEYEPPPISSNNANNPGNRYEEEPMFRRPDTPTVGYHHDPLYYHQDNYDEVYSPQVELYPPTSYIDYHNYDYNYGRSLRTTGEPVHGNHHHHYPPSSYPHPSEIPGTYHGISSASAEMLPPPQLPGEDCIADNIFGFLNNCITQLNRTIALGPLKSTMTACLIPLAGTAKDLQEAKLKFDADFVKNGHDNHSQSFCSKSGANDAVGNGHRMEHGN